MYDQSGKLLRIVRTRDEPESSDEDDLLAAVGEAAAIVRDNDEIGAPRFPVHDVVGLDP